MIVVSDTTPLIEQKIKDLKGTTFRASANLYQTILDRTRGYQEQDRKTGQQPAPDQAREEGQE
jgi:hypothetical protein